MKISFQNSILKNFGYLSILRFFEIALPLITYPYLIRVLDVSDYGNIIFAQSLVYYFTIFINYGFNISATKKVAENSLNNDKLSEIFISTITAKFILFCFSLIGMYFVLTLFNFSEKLSLLLKISFLINLYHVFYPNWYFQGLDKMHLIAIVSVSSKILFTIGIFVFVRSESDFITVPVFWVAGSFLSMLLALFFTIDKIKPTFVSLKTLKSSFSDSSPYFLSNLSVELYVNANKVVLGTFLGMREVAIYDLANKILTIVKLPTLTITQSAFPTFARKKNLNQINRYAIVTISANILMVALVLLITKPIIHLLGSDSMIESISITRILIFSSVFVTFSQFLGTARLVVFGFAKSFSKIISSSAIFYFLILVILYFTKSITLRSLTYLAVSVEFWVASLLFLSVFKKNILYEKTI